MNHRKDKKGRALKDGEYQRPDGRYEFRWKDSYSGETRSVYSWRLTETDSAPAGKKKEMSLREMKKEIHDKIALGIDAVSAKSVTVNELFERHMELSYLIRDTTRSAYYGVWNSLARDSIGRKAVGEVKYSDVKRLYLKLLRERGLAVTSLGPLNSLLHSVFALAVRDGFILHNPVKGVLTELKKQADSKPKSDRALVLTREQEKAFMDTLMETERFARWRVMFTVLFGTGLRIGELCGLTWSDVDFRQGVLHVNRTLSYGKAGGERCRFIVHPPKTEAGNREIHMTAAVREALQAEYARQALSGFCPTRIDDVVGFIFWKSSGGLYQKGEPDHAIDCIRKVWNRQEENKAAEENREPVLIPHFSCHSIRHVFITRLVESGANVKAVQYIAGHKSVLMTLDVYAASTGEGRAEAISLLEAAE